ncbi:twin-arginine translocase TatA/TatE family subunit [Pyxidicoccus xibeiensis]|uniref:twin-arginine translocase TatA/TatE family subunit n=1 Tax=Pyxidicoccus xibeiensis TaxID=2906759 RepID=UPI0020A7E0F9|nr:twin-arginine translocase TatA/TatE family subunit [Pyxidicoccus xibeiensis]MCP3142895.1 twin-arginine translocase TatA/TatE family subunit [Pyxidicoccus xibeiensis]
MFNIGAGEMMLILVAALLILGPTRLPELARGLGKFMREFRRQTDEVRNVVEREFYTMDQDISREPTAPPVRPGTPFAYSPSSPLVPPEGPALPAPGSPMLGAPEGLAPGTPDALAVAPEAGALAALPEPGAQAPASGTQVLEMDLNGPRELEASALHAPAEASAAAEPVVPTPDTPVPVPGTVARNASKRS